jgi:hypothetical protein
MNHMFRVVVVGFAAVLLMFSFASAQEDSPADGASTAITGGDISVRAATPLTATLQLNLNGEVVNIVVPGLLTIDAQATIDADAIAAGTVMPGNRVGGLMWEVESILNVGTEIEAKYGEPLISETGEFVIITAKAKNIGETEYSLLWGTEAQAIDTDSIVYEVHASSYAHVEACDSVNPGLTVRCQYLFEVPPGTELVGMNVTAKETGTIFGRRE